MSKDLFKAFGIPDMPKLIQDALGGQGAVVAATLHSRVEGARSGGITAGRTIVETDYACRGFIDYQRLADAAGTVTANGTKVIVLLGNSINGGATAPQPGDRITIEGIKYHVADDTEIDRDPASATYTCEVREV